MPTNNFKLFDENKANLLTDTEYVNSTQRLNGVQTGVASSQLNNKFAYQVSLVAYSIAQLMNANGLDASDTLAVSAFVGNLQGAILQKVADKATSAEAAAGVLSNKYITPETMKAAALLLSGGVMNGVLDMGNNRITNLGTPTADSDAVTKGYVDGKERFVKLDSIQNVDYAGVNRKYTFKGIPTMFKFVIKTINSGHGNVLEMTLFGRTLECLVDLAINYEFFAYIGTATGSSQNVNQNGVSYTVSRISSSSKDKIIFLTFDSNYTMTEQKSFKAGFANFSFNLDIYYYY